MNEAPFPARGWYEDGFEPVARQFSRQLARSEIGAAFAVHHRGRCVVDLWGGMADVTSSAPWQADTRAVVFSVTKGFTAMAMHLLVERGLFEWDAPVATYWPGFARSGKDAITVRTLMNHRAALPFLDSPLHLDDCVRADRAGLVLEALERQRPHWAPDHEQVYHAVTYGMYARELFERIAGEPIGPFLRRELFAPLGSDVHLGTPEEEDRRVATLYPPSAAERVSRMFHAAMFRPLSAEGRVARDVLGRRSLVRQTFGAPRLGRRGVSRYNDIAARRAPLAWASATASARGIARAYLPFAQGGSVDGRRFSAERTLAPLYARQSWSDHDGVLNKAVGWSQGFLKDEPGVFGAERDSFGHAGMGGSLGWCDPVHQVALGYTMNRLDWRVRSPRAVALCGALYGCEPLRASRPD
jgi:CubicO group peptidase (beta-lactamase class C family)